jgi:hypothetical protein
LGLVAKLKYTFHSNAVTFAHSTCCCGGTKRKFRNCAGIHRVQLARMALGQSLRRVVDMSPGLPYSSGNEKRRDKV